MKGHIRERSPGHWAIVVELRDPGTGKRRRKWHAFAGTKRKAQEECARLISALKGGTYLEPAKITVAGHMERWLEHVRSQVSPKTFERYCGVVRGNIVPALGGGYDEAPAGPDFCNVCQSPSGRPPGRQAGRFGAPHRLMTTGC